MESTPSLRYTESINRVIKAIYHDISKTENPDFSLDRLSSLACYSKFHFHRMFHAQVGLSVSRFIHHLRLKKSAHQLAYDPQISITEIAFDAGFENHESFSRAFKKMYQMSPRQFRKQPCWPEQMTFNFEFNNKELAMLETTICDFPTTPIAALEHQGHPKKLNQTVSSFIQWRQAADCAPIDKTETYGLAYNDPQGVRPDEFRFDVCCSTLKPVTNNTQGVINKSIPGGRCVRITHHGPYELMEEKIRYLYGVWLHDNNEEPRDFPCFFHYKNLFPHVDEHDLITDIYLPLK